MYKLQPTKNFEKTLKRLSINEQRAVAKKLTLLATSPSHPSLRTKKIQGTIELFECSVNMDIRIIWKYDGQRIILLLETGHHDILKQF